MTIDPYSGPGLVEIEAHLLSRFNQGFTIEKNKITDFIQFDAENPSHIQGWHTLMRSEQIAIRLLMTVKHEREIAGLERLADQIDSSARSV